jgi:TM2 domain-containing membrane protein YozV
MATPVTVAGPPQPTILSATNQYGEYWKTSALSFNILYFLSIIPLTGFLGLDHLYARSPKTAALKALINCLTLGWWYIYDALQVILRPDQVKTFGFSAPVVGPLGIGAGQFSGDTTDSDKAARFSIYAFLVCVVPFGIDYFYLGRNAMGFFKLFCTVIPIFLPIALIIGAWNIIKLFLLTGQVLDENYELFGSTPSLKYQEYLAKASQAERQGGWFGWFYNWLLAILQSDLLLAIPIVGPFIQLATASLNTATIAVEAAGTTIGAAKETALSVIQATGETAKGVAAVASQASQIQQAFNPESAAKAIVNARKMGGGGGDIGNIPAQILFGILCLALVSGGALAISRLVQNTLSSRLAANVRSPESTSKKQYDRPPDAGSA